MTNAPRVSVVIPTYNRLHYLREAIGSVLDQTYPHWEILVIDDGSTDGTREWLRSIQDKRIELIEVSHCGYPGRLRNQGMANAQGHYIAFLDSDDRWKPSKLDAQVGALVLGDARWSYTLFSIIDQEGNPMPILAGGPWSAQSGWILDAVIQQTVMPAIPTIMAETDLLRSLGGFEDDILWGEDLDLILRLAEAASAEGVPEALLEVREHSGRTTFGDHGIHCWWARVFDRAAQRTVDRKIRAQYQRESARHLVILAGYRSRERMHGEALRASLRAVIRTPLWIPTWFGFLKRLAWLILPRRIVSGLEGRTTNSAFLR